MPEWWSVNHCWILLQIMLVTYQVPYQWPSHSLSVPMMTDTNNYQAFRGEVNDTEGEIWGVNCDSDIWFTICPCQCCMWYHVKWDHVIKAFDCTTSIISSFLKIFWKHDDQDSKQPSFTIHFMRSNHQWHWRHCNHRGGLTITCLYIYEEPGHLQSLTVTGWHNIIRNPSE